MAKQRTDKGTHYEPRKTEQRSYFLPPGLGDAFKDFCNGNASTGIRGAMVLFMACRTFPDLRERAIRAAERMEVAAAVEEIESQFIDVARRKAFDDIVQSLPAAEKAKLVTEYYKKR